MTRRRLTFMTDNDDVQSFEDRVLLDEGDPTLGDLLADFPVLCTVPLSADHLQMRLAELRIDVIPIRPDQPGYLPPGARLGSAPGGDPATAGTDGATAGPAVPAGDQDRPGEVTADGQHPRRINDREAVLLAHQLDIERAASYLESGLSVLVRAEKILVSHLAEEIAARSGRVTRTIRLDRANGQDAPAAGLPGLPSSRRSELLDVLIEGLSTARPGDLVVVPHLDLLAGGNDATLNAEARELADAVYEAADCVLLAFFDPSLILPEVLASRFAVRLPVDILPRQVITLAGPVPTGRALVTRDEADLFVGFDEIGLYKHVAGLNAVRLRHALRYAAHQHRTPPGPDAERPTFGKLVAELQTFKAKTSSSFEVPNVDFDDIGGYQLVKDELRDALDIVGGAAHIPEGLRTELVPAGFIFHGPPGTGKTLFAKAAATAMGATILVVSGPEITDKYVGESERKLRDIFAEARRNAPSVIVFDEFDSIAARRTGQPDGGNRAGNAVVAQLLTELDGFRPEVPVLIIGTTNRLDIIDEALLRPSRFRPIEIGQPDLGARRQIAKYHAGHFGVEASERLLDHIAASTEGCSGDDIRSLFRDARAGELVGSRRPADAYRLGQILGELRRSRRQREAGRTGAGTTAADGSRRAMTTPVVLTTRTRSITPADTGEGNR
ncbi:ATP-binding protein [Actinoplanes derwentensis]|uniref:Transitional endoplasmic reticulum ATPase n=1 Tax=Actinoplanes derwentensis TaxID=113562 RepID=A0A1H2AIW8_9ACTN|nr:ATP-binding protein [Actinoplanes derwentensis]GID90301.1 hypothetical protein Ade03nite_92250 [Actinoplanes derwentensis]SDT45767.1 transitional endoplasmic reticulum ATPase [Actinoplanes derwentensis]